MDNSQALPMDTSTHQECTFLNVPPEISQIYDEGEVEQERYSLQSCSSISIEEVDMCYQVRRKPKSTTGNEILQKTQDQEGDGDFIGCCNSNNFVQHVFQFMSENSHVCTICIKNIVDVSKLKCHVLSHFRIHTTQSTIACYTRNPSMSALVKSTERAHVHKSSPPNFKMFPCSLCSKAFAWRSSLSRHMLIHLSARDRMPVTKKVHQKHRVSPFPKQKSVLSRETALSPGWKTQEDCIDSSFGKWFTQDLENVVVNKSGHDIFKCHVCSKAFSGKSNLIRHTKTHCQSQPPTRRFSSEAFPLNITLARRKAALSGPPPFSCDVCTKRFSQKSQLTRHKTVHSDQRPFVCSVCGKAFAWKSSLDRHLKVHPERDTCPCGVCGLAFQSPPSLASHAMVHRVDGLFTCQICRKMFSSKPNLRRHMKRH